VAFITSTVVQKSESPFFFGEQQRQGQASGSGFVINRDGTILTNYHVIENAIKVNVSFEKGKTVEAQVLGKDPSNDLAVLRIPTDGLTLHPLVLGDSSTVQVGDAAYAIGNPFDLQRTLTAGVISALQREIIAPNGFRINNVLQTDAPINPGNSGGPLLNSHGQVIGINSQIETGGGSNGNVGIGFAIPIDTIRAEIQQLEDDGKVTHAFIGISGASVTPDLARAVNLPVDEGVLVQTVVKDGPAAKAGIEGGNTSATLEGAEVRLGGDIVTKLGGKKVAGMEDLVDFVNGAKSGDEVEVTYLRNGDERTVTVTLGDRPASAE
jgi:S1-C subfamily serine protease